MHRQRRVWQVVAILCLAMVYLSACGVKPTATAVPHRPTSQPQDAASFPPSPPTVAIPLLLPPIERAASGSESYPLPTARPRTPGVDPLPDEARSYPPPAGAPQSPEAAGSQSSPPAQQQVRVQVDELQVSLLESLPTQVQVTVRGSLPNGCARITKIAQTREGTRFFISIGATKDPNAICTQALVPFEESVTLDTSGLAPGTYSVQVHGVVAPLTLSADMVATLEPDAACSPTDPDLVAFSEPDGRFCFVYPRGFGVSEPETAVVVLSGPSSSSQGPGPITITLTIRDLGSAGGVGVRDLAENHLADLSGRVTLAQALTTLGGQPAVVVDGLPGEHRSRRIYVVQDDTALELTLYPVDHDSPVATREAEALWQIVRRSFTFLSTG